MDRLQLRAERQVNPVADEVAAVTAAVRPILQGTLFTLKRDVADAVGGYDRITLEMLARVYRQGDGDCGICFEYAVHDAMVRGNPAVVERVLDAVTNYCKVPGDDPASILFAVEKSGSEQIVNTQADLLSDHSLLMSGTRGRPVKLRRHLSRRRLTVRVGCRDDRWGSSVEVV
ncbi:MAG TPA: hypothetical protein VFW63_01215 [Acidimicrobiales bacterium]|nr:hypothetical protein [Acidimicrobiales bacterium]